MVDPVVYNYMPHSHCLVNPTLIGWHVISDMAIFLAYMVISANLIYFADYTYVFRPRWVTFAFALFIFSCGLTHLFDALVVWYPMYRFQLAIKLLTAISSLGTAAGMLQIIKSVREQGIEIMFDGKRNLRVQNQDHTSS